MTLVYTPKACKDVTQLPVSAPCNTLLQVSQLSAQVGVVVRGAHRPPTADATVHEAAVRHRCRPSLRCQYMLDILRQGNKSTDSLFGIAPGVVGLEQMNSSRNSAHVPSLAQAALRFASTSAMGLRPRQPVRRVLSAEELKARALGVRPAGAARRAACRQFN